MIQMKNIDETTTLQEYIEAYEEIFKHSIDMSPYVIARDTEKKMLR